MRRAVLLLVLVTVAAADPADEPAPPIDLGVQLQLSLASKRREFHIGEIIPIKLSFSSRVRDRYEVDQAQYDRSGRMDSERFDVTPSDGIVDPLAEYFADGSHIGGGLRGIELLTPRPWAIHLNLNEWVRFTKPGEYKLRVSSNRVSLVDPSSASGTSPVTALSNEITLKILPVTTEWEKRTYDAAVAELKSKSAATLREGNDSPARHAFETLRFLATPEATRELVKQMRGDGGGCDETCFFGVVASPHRTVARAALEAAVSDPEHPVGDDLLDALVFIARREEAATGDVKRLDTERAVLNKLVLALPNKRGEAARASLYTALDRGLVRADAQLLSPETTQQLTAQLIAMFDELPAEQKETLLDRQWNEIKSPELVPLLKRYAQDEREGARIADKALQRWYELDPADARPFIIGEITGPDPRVSGAALRLLPDETLPEVDHAFAQHLGSDAFDPSPAAASIVAQYASVAILPQVLKKLDQGIGTWACQVQNALLAYVLRVHPAAAKPRIERAIAARAETATQCYRVALSDVARIHYDPLLGEVALAALEDPDAEVAMDAADVVKMFGSAGSESSLWQQFERWCKRWQGRESELMRADVTARAQGVNDLQRGVQLLTALVTGRGWLTDDAKLRQLATLSAVPRVREEIDRYLKRWEALPLRVTVYNCGSKFSLTVAQYQFNSLAEFDEKLAQFPSGTEFSLSPAPGEEDESCVAELRRRLTTRGML